MEKDIISEIERQKSSMTDGDEMLLILDQPDFLLAATGASMGIGATEMAEWVTGLQQVRMKTTSQPRYEHELTSPVACTRHCPDHGC
jgi:hypothetical protein